MKEDKLQLSLPASKSDLFQRGITITVANAFDEECAVASTGNLFATFPIPHSSLLFSTTSGNAFICQYVTRVLRSAIQDLGYTGHYAGHLFRRGATTWAQEVGLTDVEVWLLGRWESDFYLLYIETSQAVLLNASRQFQRR